MKRIDKIYTLDLIINNQARKDYDYDLIKKLIDTNYLDWFGWFDEKIGRHKHKINATHKGMLYYTENRNNRKTKWVALLCVVLIILPIALILMEGIL